MYGIIDSPSMARHFIAQGTAGPEQAPRPVDDIVRMAECPTREFFFFKQSLPHSELPRGDHGRRVAGARHRAEAPAPHTAAPPFESSTRDALLDRPHHYQQAQLTCCTDDLRKMDQRAGPALARPRRAQAGPFDDPTSPQLGAAV
jgi:hypothetical protein